MTGRKSDETDESILTQARVWSLEPTASLESRAWNPDSGCILEGSGNEYHTCPALWYNTYKYLYLYRLHPREVPDGTVNGTPIHTVNDTAVNSTRWFIGASHITWNYASELRCPLAVHGPALRDSLS